MSFLKSGFFFFSIALILAQAAAKPVASNATHGLAKREPQGACGAWSETTILVGDGDPHTDRLHIQISDTLDCGDGTCTITHEQSVSTTIGASLGGAFEWIDGGFDVSQSVETGQGEECNGDPGERVCVFSKVNHRAYTVQDADYNVCTGMHPRDPTYIMTSPTEMKAFECMKGDSCGLLGSSYWEYNVPPDQI